MNPNDKSKPADFDTCAARADLAAATDIDAATRETLESTLDTIDEIDDLQATYQRTRDGAQ